MNLADFHYDLPPDRVARFPAEERDGARLLVCSGGNRKILRHHVIRDLPRLLQPGDVLVLNETKVLPHRLVGHRRSGGRVECLVLERIGAACVGFLRPSERLQSGELLPMEGGALELVVGPKLGGGRHRFSLVGRGGTDPGPVLEAVGRAPLPPYLKRRGDHEDVAADRGRYQTVFAREPGAIAAPTAGLHLTERLLEELEDRGIRLARVVLHVGEGTFEPIRTRAIEDHVMHAERFALGEGAVRAIEEARAAGGRVFCVGTTSLRVLETCFDPRQGHLVARSGETSLYLYPGRGPRYADGLLTNFHLPQSTLLLLVASILGRERTLELYELAIRQGYRFYSFGDAMLILP